MDDQDGEPIANRDDTIPVLRIPSHSSQGSGDFTNADPLHLKPGGRRERMKEHASKIKERLVEHGSPYAPSIQERLFTGLMAQIIPPEDLDENEELAQEDGTGKPKDRRSRQYVDRPNFSVGMMSGNFRRFNARIGIVFVFQNRLIRLFTWKQPTATLSFLAIYSLVCLDPELLPLVPLVATLFLVMLPSFLARHPTAENDLRLDSRTFGPPVAPPSRVKPAPELSKDFFRNMRDLQNCMEDFSRMHDAANEYVTPYTNFSDEGVSSELYLVLFVLSIIAFIASHLMPWRAVALLGGWAAVTSGHPSAQSIILSTDNLKQFTHTLDGVQAWIRNWIERDIILDEPAEVRQVEIFELQKHHQSSGTWESWLFSPSPYDPLSPSRIAGARAKGTQFFEEVQPPSGWRWKDKKWSLDLFSREWVERRIITGVEIETEGERWVYDLPVEDVETASLKKQRAKSLPKSGWEEGNGMDKKGLWRRRRWVRDVERVVVKASVSD
jgi:hypothetical protein